jgi:hypothetical protein
MSSSHAYLDEKEAVRRLLEELTQPEPDPDTIITLIKSALFNVIPHEEMRDAYDYEIKDNAALLLWQAHFNQSHLDALEKVVANSSDLEKINEESKFLGCARWVIKSSGIYNSPSSSGTLLGAMGVHPPQPAQDMSWDDWDYNEDIIRVVDKLDEMFIDSDASNKEFVEQIAKLYIKDENNVYHLCSDLKNVLDEEKTVDEMEFFYNKLEEKVNEIKHDTRLKNYLDRSIELAAKGLVYKPAEGGLTFLRAVENSVGKSLQRLENAGMDDIMSAINRPVVLVSEKGDSAVNLDKEGKFARNEPVFIYDRRNGKYDALLVAPGQLPENVMKNVVKQQQINDEKPEEPATRITFNKKK